MNIGKIFVTVFFGLFGLILFCALSTVGGLAGGGISLLVAGVTGSIIIGSVVGAAIAAFAFHGLMKAIDNVLIGIAKKKADADGNAPTPPSLTEDNKHYWGSASYFISTLVGVNLVHALVADQTWNIIATIVASGILGLLGLGVVVGLKLWSPSLRRKE